MIVKTIIFSLVFFPVVSSSLNAQDIYEKWEKYLELNDETEGQTYALEELERLMENPVDLNSAALQEFSVIPGFPIEGARAILKNRPFESLQQVQRLLNVDDDQWNWLRQFLTALPVKNRARVYAQARIRWARPFEASRGFAEGRFEGGIAKIYQRFRVGRKNSFRFGALFEKDSGEQALSDHFVFSFEKQWGEKGPVLILGDFRVRLGMGLIVAPPFSTRKGADIFSVTRANKRAFMPFVSTSESGYFRGVGLRVSYGSLQLGGWISDLNVDAGLTTQGEISSLDMTGLHRTETEKAKMGSAHNRTIGGFLGYMSEIGMALEVAMLTTEFSPGISPNNNEPEGWRLSGSEARYLGVNLRGRIGQVAYFGEIARSHLDANAFLIGAARHWPDIKILIIRRHYSKRYDNPFAQAFGEQSGARNEQGWYLATELKLKLARISLGFDQFKTPWRTYSNNMPQSGSEVFLQWHQKVNRNFRILLRISTDTKLDRYRDSTQPAYYQRNLIPFSRSRFRLHFSSMLNKEYRMAGRLEKVNYGPQAATSSSEKGSIRRGWLCYWDFRRTSSANQLLGGARFTFFDTESSDAQLYEFEQDLPGVVSNKALSGRGVRFYLYLQKQLASIYRISAKYSVIRYTNRQSIGVGWDEINSPARHDISVQLDVRL